MLNFLRDFFHRLSRVECTPQVGKYASTFYSTHELSGLADYLNSLPAHCTTPGSSGSGQHLFGREDLPQHHLKVLFMGIRLCNALLAARIASQGHYTPRGKRV